MRDLIERQAAIKAIENLQDCYNGFSETYDKACIIGVLEEIPIAQVNTPTDTPTDTISRQAAIDAIRASTSKYTGFMEMEMYTDDDAVEAINGVPSAQPERKTGKWISYIEDGYLECPFCGAATNCDGDESELHFCFSCGAKMEVLIDV